MPRGSKPGERRGGRVKGTKNKKTQVIEEILESLNCNPIQNLARIANGESMRAMVGFNKDIGDYLVDDVPPTLDQRLAANKELAQYAFPKRKAVEHTGPDGGAIVITWADHI